MSWREELRIYFEKEDYEQCISLLKKELAKPFCDDEDLSLNLMYVYMYMFMLKKESNTESQMTFSSKNIRIIYKYIIKKYKKNAKAIFYTAYTASIAEWLLKLDIEDLNEMHHKAWILEPSNKLYEYGYYLYYLNNHQKANTIFEEIRNDKTCWQKIKMMSILGDSFIGAMEFFYNRKN